MEGKKLGLRYLLSIVVVGVITTASFFPSVTAYAPHTTHAGLTQEILAYHNASDARAFSGAASELIIQASIDEDNPSTRALNHFYDPVFNRGINEYRTAVEWAVEDYSGNTFAWGKGIEAYARGDATTSYLVLGHVLHLLEDSSVPDHTRNDPHIGHGASGLYTGESPMEEWGDAKKTRQTLAGLGESYVRSGLVKSDCPNVKACFYALASYSNANFYSADTIPGVTGGEEYEKPVTVRRDHLYGYARDTKDGAEYRVWLVGEDKEGQKIPMLAFGTNSSVLDSYFDRLSPHVISYGAQVIDLYLDEAEAARTAYLEAERAQREAALAEQLSLHASLEKKGFFGLLAYGAKERFIAPPASAFASAKDVVSEWRISASENIKIASNEFGHGVNGVGTSLIRGTDSATEAGSQFAQQKIDDVGDAVREIDQTLQGPGRSGLMTSPALISIRNSATPPPATVPPLASTSASESVPATFHRRSLAAIEAALRALLAEAEAMQNVASAVAGTSTLAIDDVELPADNTLAISPAVRIDEGTPQGSSPSTVTQFFVILASLDGESSPLPPIDPPAEDPAPEIATSTDLETNATSTPVLDTTAPDVPVILLPSEGETLAQTTFLLTGTAEASSTLLIAWDEGDHATILSLRVPDTGLWEAELELPEGETEVRVAARDDAGNLSSDTIRTIRIALPPPASAPRAAAPGDLVFNELLFPCRSDEAVELANMTNDTLILDGIRLTSSDPSIDVTLSGTIDPRGFHTVAISLEGTPGLSDIGSSTQVFRAGPPAPLSPDPFTYTLSGSSGGPLDTAVSHRAFWCGAVLGKSVEKIRSSDPSHDPASWSQEFPFIRNGIASDGSPIFTTFGKRNSRSYIMPVIHTDTELEAEGGPYIVWDASEVVPTGVTLTLGPGVHVYFFAQDPASIPNYYRPELLIDGTLRVLGTPDAPVRLASFEDPSAREDFDLAELAAPRSYGDIIFRPGSEGEIAYAEFSHLGVNALTFDAASGTLAHVRLEASRSGVHADNGSTLEARDILLRDLDTFAVSLEGRSRGAFASTTLEDISNAGFSAVEGSTLLLDRVDAEDVRGSAVRADGGSVVSATEVTLSSELGAGVFLFGATLEIASSTIAGASNNAGILAIQSDVVVASSTIMDNRVGIEAHVSDVLVASSTVSGNGTNIVNDASTIVVE